MSEIDRYRKLENRRREVQKEITSIITRRAKLDAKLERRKLELAEITRERADLLMEGPIE